MRSACFSKLCHNALHGSWAEFCNPRYKRSTPRISRTAQGFGSTAIMIQIVIDSRLLCPSEYLGVDRTLPLRTS